MPALILRTTNIQDQPVVNQRHVQIIGAAARALRMEIIFFQKIKDRDLAFLFLVARHRAQRLLVEVNALQSVSLAISVGH